MRSVSHRSTGADTEAPEVSIVVPLLNEEANIAELHRRLTSALMAQHIDFELLWVNDGSTDRTANLIDDLAGIDPRLTVLHLSRTFGHQAAISAGIDHARGRAIFLMDGDLQDPPEVCGQFLQLWRAGNDVVYAIRTKRKEGLLKRAAYFLFYRVFRAISDFDIPLDSGDFCLMDRKVVDALRSLPERERFVRGLRTFVGYKQVGLAYERDARHAGEPSYTFRKLRRLALDGLVSFSSFPLALVAYLGFFSLLLAVGLTIWALLDAWIGQTAPRGWASTITIVLYMSSMQLLSLGIVAQYLRHIFNEVKQRPTYLVGRVVSHKASAHTATNRSPTTNAA